MLCRKGPIVFNHRMRFVKAPHRLIHSRDHPTAYRLYARIVTDPEISVLTAFGRFRFQPSHSDCSREVRAMDVLKPEDFT